MLLKSSLLIQLASLTFPYSDLAALVNFLRLLVVDLGVLNKFTVHSRTFANYCKRLISIEAAAHGLGSVPSTISLRWDRFANMNNSKLSVDFSGYYRPQNIASHSILDHSWWSGANL